MPKTPVFAAVALTLATASVSNAVVGAESAPPPKPWLESIVDKARKLATREVKPETPEAEKWKTEIKGVIDEILDWEELTKRALGRNWDERTPKEQQEFALLLREMIEASYQSKLKMATGGKTKKAAKVEIEWLDEKVTGTTGAITARIKADKTVAVLGFDLRYSANRWRVADVSIDDVSTVRTYRSQFGKIIAKDGFAGLITRMRKKTEEIRAGRGDVTPP